MGVYEHFEFTVRLNTPAFLGDAFQKGQWRTPPFKALLRWWWRVVKACEILGSGKAPDEVHRLVREAEGRLFGHAWLEDLKGNKWAAQSRVRIRLLDWEEGKGKTIPSVKYVCHKEVDLSRLPQKVREKYFCKEHNAYHLVNPLVYLGYGAVFEKTVKQHLSIDQSVRLIIVCNGDICKNELEVALRLVHLFGTIGGRSRNGWGSLVLESKDGEILLNISEVLNRENGDSRRWLHSFARDWKEALDLDWCHAIGKDGEGLLFWRSENGFSTWQEAMRHLAEVKIALRTQFHFKGAGPHNSMCDRQVLAYPVMKHSLKEWGSQSRSANQLLFKVHKLGERYVPIAVHLPHGIPDDLKKKLNSEDRVGLRKREEDVWKGVHALLDQRMDRLP